MLSPESSARLLRIALTLQCLHAPQTCEKVVKEDANNLGVELLEDDDAREACTLNSPSHIAADLIKLCSHALCVPAVLQTANLRSGKCLVLQGP